jgi:cell division protein DivIC
MKILSSVLGFLKNKYLIASVLFIVWMLFFDPKDWGLINARINKLKDLQESEQHLDQQIKDTREELSLLKTSAETIEKYAREKYYMKKDNEDLFIVNSSQK